MKRLAQDGAKVVLSSRKRANVEEAVRNLAAQDLDVSGTVCHVGLEEDRKNLVDFVSVFSTVNWSYTGLGLGLI